MLEYLFLEAKEGRRYNVVSVPLVMEYEDVLLREKSKEMINHLSNDEISMFVSDMVTISYRTKLHYLWRPFLKDSGDDKVLETAVNGMAKFIVTFNPKDFQGVEKQFEIKIVSPKQFLQYGGLI